MDEGKKKGVLENAQKGLGEAIYALTWVGILWGEYGAIKLSEIRYKVLCDLDREQGAVRDLLSTYYTAHNNALAQQKIQAQGWVSISNRGQIARIKKLAVRLDQFPEKTLGDCMVLSRVYFLLKQYERAYSFSTQALEMARVPQEKSQENLALITVEIGEILVYMNSSDGEGEKMIVKALNNLEYIFSDVEIKVRILKTAASAYIHLAHDWRNRTGGTEMTLYDVHARCRLEQAHNLAVENSLGDQLVKIKSLQRELESLK